MEQNKIRIGMLISYHGEYGVVRDIDDGVIGVEFFRHIYGRHDLDGAIKSKNGYWLSIQHLEPAKFTWKKYFELSEDVKNVR